MRKGEYKRIRANLEAELTDAKAKVETIQRRIDSLDVVWHELMAPESDAKDCQSSTEPGPAAILEGPEGQHLNVIDAVRLVVDRRAEFTIHDVMDDLLEAKLTNGTELKRTTVSGILTKLHESGAVHRVKEGLGRNAAIYRRSVPITQPL